MVVNEAKQRDQRTYPAQGGRHFVTQRMTISRWNPVQQVAPSQYFLVTLKFPGSLMPFSLSLLETISSTSELIQHAFVSSCSYKRLATALRARIDVENK